MQQLLNKIKLCLKTEAGSILIAKIRTNEPLKQDITYLRELLYRVQRDLYSFLRTKLLVLIICLLLSISIYFTFTFQSELESFFSSKDKLTGLRSLLLTLGGALIGATAIAFTLIMFAMQVNVERLPHGLFRKFSRDARIMWSFVITFTLAITVTITSLIPDETWVTIVILSTTWETALIILLFLYAYRRALLLINPIQQLNILIKYAINSMKAWDKWLKKTTPQFEKKLSSQEDERQEITHDMARVALLKRYPNWTFDSKQAIQYAMSFASRYTEQGDHDVASAAFAAVVRINQSYVNVKGKTFFDNNIFYDHPLASDDFINDTLEHLRLAVKTGVSRGDERFIEQTFRAMEKLVEVYVSIDYCNQRGTKEHAVLAAGYLSNAIESVIPHDMADVLMEGTRLLGQSSQILLAFGDPTSASSSVSKISTFACIGAVKDKYRPVTLVAMEQLSSLTFNLINTLKYDIRFIAKNIRDSITMIAKLFLNTQDTPLGQVHNTYLGPYYSSTTAQSFLYMLGNLANVISDKDADDVEVKKIINNIEIWADGLYDNEKELLLFAIEKRSSFVFDIINWIKTIPDILMAISNADVCDDIVKEKLQKHAQWIICTFTFIPKDKDTVAFIASYNLTETLFEAAMIGYSRKCIEVSSSMQRCLLDWGFKAGRHQIGWAILESSIYGLATLALSTGSPNPAGLREQIKNIMSEPDTPDQDMKDRTAREIRCTADTLYRDNYRYSQIEYQMHKVDTTKMKVLLNELADLISPETTDEQIRTSIF